MKPIQVGDIVICTAPDGVFRVTAVGNYQGIPTVDIETLRPSILGSPLQFTSIALSNVSLKQPWWKFWA